MARKKGKKNEEERARRRGLGHGLFLLGMACIIVAGILVVLGASADMIWFIILICLAGVIFFVAGLGYSMKRRSLFSIVICLFGILTCLLGLAYLHGLGSFSGKVILGLVLFCAGIISAWIGWWIIIKSIPPSPFSQNQPPTNPPKRGRQSLLDVLTDMVRGTSVIFMLKNDREPESKSVGGVNVFTMFIRLIRNLLPIIVGVSLTLLERLIALLRAVDKGSLGRCSFVSLASLVIAAGLWWKCDLLDPLFRKLSALFFVAASVTYLIIGFKNIRRPVYH